MTGDELAAALYQAQGYLVMRGSEPWKVGEVSDRPLCDIGLKTPMRVVGESSREEMEKQKQLAISLFPSIISTEGEGYDYFYRVEAAD